MGDLKEEVVTAISEQITREYAASLFYRQAYHWFDLNLFPGTAKFFRKEAEEETKHAHLLEEYLLHRNATFELTNIPVESKKPWAKPLDIFEEAYVLELKYRDHLEALAATCRKHNDELSVLKVCELLNDQVESCNEFEVLLKKAKAYSALEGLYYHLDHELGEGEN